jgi:hypothetical protein
VNKEAFKKLWGSPVGKDCVSLDTSMCKWLGDRLIFLANNTQSAPIGHTEMRWRRELTEQGHALLAWGNKYETNADETIAYPKAQKAMRWVARNLGKLWD